MTDNTPDRIGVCAFKDGTLEAYRDLADIPPSTPYTRSDNHVVIPRDELEAMRIPQSPDPYQEKADIINSWAEAGHNNLIDKLLKEY